MVVFCRVEERLGRYVSTRCRSSRSISTLFRLFSRSPNRLPAFTNGFLMSSISQYWSHLWIQICIVGFGQAARRQTKSDWNQLSRRRSSIQVRDIRVSVGPCWSILNIPSIFLTATDGVLRFRSILQSPPATLSKALLSTSTTPHTCPQSPQRSSLESDRYISATLTF